MGHHRRTLLAVGGAAVLTRLECSGAGHRAGRPGTRGLHDRVDGLRPAAHLGPGRATAGRKVLAQTSKDTTDYRFPLAIFDQPVAADLDVAVRFRPVSGEVDRAAGLAVRLADANNYYVVRANALEDNVRLYAVGRANAGNSLAPTPRC